MKTVVIRTLLDFDEISVWNQFKFLVLSVWIFYGIGNWDTETLNKNCGWVLRKCGLYSEVTYDVAEPENVS